MNQLRNAKSSIEEEPSSPPPTPNKVFGPDEEPNPDMNQLRNAKSSIEEEPSSPPPTPTFRYEDGSGKQVRSCIQAPLVTGACILKIRIPFPSK
eukprot:CAMPEP_0184325824 /NCGR_PEP_ID=MMETSP1049-20130417/142235_1 /TAXON_ID=77928 /ORGANISM="Proteomonas sulcata, Strain CCMP704" /LENGTH=93 /DNA_ID=CAMNT_0026647983 /DNA_START=991 /DNA_END=1272 /DNA_ORIENTATION=+